MDKELSKGELRQFANVIFNLLGLGFIGRAAFIDDCIAKFKEQDVQVSDTTEAK